ncbi:MAG: hypothetical protein ACRDHZ_13805 [Ktedonobacteraceae bacterium]
MRHINAGSSGSLLALAEVVGAFNHANHRAVLEDGAHSLISESQEHISLLPGLYVGEAGVGAALLRAGQVLQ